MSRVTSNNNIVFGQQSPFYRIATEAGVYSNLYTYLTEGNTRMIRNRTFDIYRANEQFPNSIENINEYIRHAIRSLIFPFIQNVRTPNLIKNQLYKNGEIALSNELQKATGIKNLISIVVDCEKELPYKKTGITTFIIQDFVKGKDIQQDITWNGNFFSLTDNTSVAVIIAIPKNYLISLITNINNSSESVRNGATSFLKNNELTAVATDAICADLIKSFFSAFYCDGHRMNVNRDIAILDMIFQEKGEDIFINNNEEGFEDELTPSALIENFSKYKNYFKNDYLKIIKGNEKNLIYNTMRITSDIFNSKNREKSVFINPLEFYNGFIDLPYSKLEWVFSKMNNFTRFERNLNYTIMQYNICNNSNEIDKFFTDSNGYEVILYAIKLVRYIPWLLFDVYVLGGGSHHNDVSRILYAIKNEFIPVLRSESNKSILTSKTISFLLSQIEYFINTLWPHFNSPLKINSKTRSVIFNATKMLGSIPSENEKTSEENSLDNTIKSLFKSMDDSFNGDDV